jgi:hypothetical protein
MRREWRKHPALVSEDGPILEDATTAEPRAFVKPDVQKIDSAL